LKEAPAVEKYPHAYRWYKHIASHESEFSKLPGDPSKEATAYGPGSEELTLNPAKAPEKAEEEDDEVDLFGSDEEEDEENEKLKAARVEEYKQKKAGKAKPAAKSIVTLDVKPWGMSNRIPLSNNTILTNSQMTRPP
jgi:elongation factor 1-beta